MSIIIGILLAIFVFLLVVVVHEFGHFIVARICRMHVEEFGFWIPPKIIRIWKDKKWTEYTFNLLPIGGFVRILGEDPTWPDAEKKWAFMTRPWIQRILVLIAWVTMNFFLAFVIFTTLFALGVSPITVNPLSSEPTDSYFIPSLDEAIRSGYAQHDWVEISAITWSIASAAWITQWEKVIQVNGTMIHTPKEFMDLIDDNNSIEIITENNAIQKTTRLNPLNGKIWVYVWYHNLRINREFESRFTWIQALSQWIHETYASSILTLNFLWKMLHGIFVPNNPIEYQEAKNMLSWPIGVWATFVGLVEMSAPIWLIWVVIALISVNLWVINLLPIPALDGWRIVTTSLYSLFVWCFGARKTQFLQWEKYFHAGGFILLLLLTLYVAGLDISRFF